MSDSITTPERAPIDMLATALAKAQAAMGNVEKSGINPAFKSPDKPKGSTYSTLADVISAIRGPLTANDLSWTQFLGRTQSGVAVTTALMHKSGQSIEGTLEMPCGANASAQAIGSAISYGRRYSLLAMLGLASDDDDDGNAAVQSQRDAPRQEQRREPDRPAYSAPADTAAIDAELQSLVKQLHEQNRDNTVTALRKLAMLPAPPTKLSPEQKQIFLRTLTQKLRATEEDGPPPDDDMPDWGRP